MTGKEMVFVVGMHRSGTSLVAELIHAMGYEVPGPMLETLEQINAHGFWESRQVVELNERLLADAGGAWFQVGFEFDPTSDHSPAHASIVADMKAFLDRSLGEHDRLVVKDPRLCHLLPAWLRLIDRSKVHVKVVWVSRDPFAVARSLAARDGFSESTGLLLWLDSFFAGLRAIAGLSCLLVDFDRLLIDGDTRERLAGYIGSPIAPASWSSIVDPGLAHHRTETAGSSPAALLAFACHEAIEHGAQISPEFSARVADLRRRYVRMRRGLGDFIADLAKTNAALVESKRLAMHVGTLHSKALGVIAANQKALVELGNLRELAARLRQGLIDRDGTIEERNRHVAQCESRIRELAEALARRDEDVARNADYIETCHRRIRELHSSLSEFEALRTRLSEVESALTAHVADTASNARYIDSCHRRIAELDEAMIEFEALRSRLTAVESMLAERDAEIARKNIHIEACEDRLRELDPSSNLLPSAPFAAGRG